MKLVKVKCVYCRIAEVSVGSLNASVVHPREVFAEAIKNKAASVVFAHNHPSGDPASLLKMTYY